MHLLTVSCLVSQAPCENSIIAHHPLRRQDSLFVPFASLISCDPDLSLAGSGWRRFPVNRVSGPSCSACLYSSSTESFINSQELCQRSICTPASGNLLDVVLLLRREGVGCVHKQMDVSGALSVSNMASVAR